MPRLPALEHCPALTSFPGRALGQLPNLPRPGSNHTYPDSQSDCHDCETGTVLHRVVKVATSDRSWHMCPTEPLSRAIFVQLQWWYQALLGMLTIRMQSHEGSIDPMIRH